MLPDKQNNFLKVKKNLGRDHKNKGKGDERNNDFPNGYKFPSDCVITCQKSSAGFLCEKKGDLLKALEKDLGKNSKAFEPEDSYDNLSDDEDGKVCLEETAESTTPEHLAYETSESDFEGGVEKDQNSEAWRENSENNFESIYGLQEIKEALLNIVIYPSIYPQFFPRRIRWNQVLLYGPPGTGKTMLAKALASEINASLHRITSADLLSHWQGQTEKQIRDLFRELRANSEPTILFFDEIDGLFRKRSTAEDESTRRIKTELLIHLDDFTAQFESHQTFLIGATNCPWEIDPSFMRRFHKKILVPLPNKEARLEIIKRSFEDVETDLSEAEWNEIGERTEGYSGSDLVNVVMTSCCERFMQARKSKHWEAKGDLWVPVGSESLFSTRVDFEEIRPDKVGVRSVMLGDLTAAIAKTGRTVGPEEMSKYLEFSQNKSEQMGATWSIS